jgi:hypothetical protein
MVGYNCNLVSVFPDLVTVPNTDGQKFLKHFMEELKDQLRGTTKR